MSMTGRRLLVIDDHPESGETLRRMIERRGGTVEVALTLREGLVVERSERIHGRPFDCVVADFGLPNTTFNEVLEALKTLRSIGIPVCGWTGSDEASEVVAACLAAQIKIVLKATSAEGIMEAILETLPQKPGADLEEIAHAIVDNRERVREVPWHSGFFFFTWSRMAQAWTLLGGVGTVATAIITFSLATLGKMDAHVVAREAVKQSSAEYTKKVNGNTEHLEKSDKQIRDLQDHEIETKTMLQNALASLSRIEDKLEGIKMDRKKTDAMWQQRLEHKTNADLGREGVKDTLIGPAESVPDPESK